MVAFRGHVSIRREVTLFELLCLGRWCIVVGPGDLYFFVCFDEVFCTERGVEGDVLSGAMFSEPIREHHGDRQRSITALSTFANTGGQLHAMVL